MESSDGVILHVRGKVIYLLILVIVVQSIYPITGGGAVWATILYQVLYAGLVAAGIVVAHESRWQTAVLIVLGVLWLISGPIYAFNQTERWALLLGYVTLMPFQAMVIQVLLRFIFATRKIDRDVLYVATAVYLLLGAIFVPAYGLLETVQPGSFVDGAVATGNLFPWQHFVYYSYATLTTLGYGDVLPVTMWARSLASIEAIVGVLYLTVIMARLVGLYAGEKEGG